MNEEYCEICEQDEDDSCDSCGNSIHDDIIDCHGHHDYAPTTDSQGG